MGTRGYLFIRYRGRYFVYYNHFDSYPEGLGEAILALIPDDPVKYNEWLESMRRTYGRLCQQFEEHHLPVEATTDDQLPPSENHAKCFLALDDRLEAPPLQTLCFSNDLFIEWTYTIDLDQELFLVDSTAAFVLPKISRDMREIKYLSKDDRGRAVFSKNTPKDIIGTLVSRPDVDSQAKLRYGEFSVNVVLPKIMIDVRNTNPRNPHEFLMLTGFQAVFYEYQGLLDDHVLTWMPQDFSFREIAFALLSIAAGEVSFECPATLNRNYEKEGYLLVPDERIGNYQQKLLPVFLGETHLPGTQSGSAPMSTTFWFGSVLVYLVSRLDLLDVEESSVSKAVDTGLSQGLKSFHAVVFSILDFVLVQVWVGDSGRVYVERSPLMSLFHSISKTSRDATPDGRSDSGSMERAEDDISPSEPCTVDEAFHGFMALVHFFDAAENQRLRGSKSKVFPNEILANIMKFSESGTSLALAKTSACCREERRRRFPLGNDYNLVGFHRIEDGWNMNLADKETGKTSLVPMDGSANGMRLNLVIGVADATRQSIMRETTLYLPGIAPKNPIFAKTVNRPEQDGYCRFSGHCLPDESGLVLDIPAHAYPGIVEKAWGQYVARILNSEYPGFSFLSASKYNCLLPHRYRELLHDYPGRDLLAIVRCSSDESPAELSETLKYAVHRLSFREEVARARGSETRGYLVIVAFGTKVKPFYYAFHEESQPSDSPAPDFCNSEIPACVTDPDPVNRLLPALRGQIEPFDIKDEYPRKYLEHLVSKLGGRGGIDVPFKFDPATQSFVDCDSGSRDD